MAGGFGRRTVGRTRVAEPGIVDGDLLPIDAAARSDTANRSRGRGHTLVHAAKAAKSTVCSPLFVAAKLGLRSTVRRLADGSAGESLANAPRRTTIALCCRITRSFSTLNVGRRRHIANIEQVFLANF